MGCCESSDKKDNKALKKIVVKNRWKIISQLGKGSFGFVYEVYDVNKEDGKTYAMKVEFLKSATGRLPQEAMILEELATLQLNAHVAEIFDKGPLTEHGDRPRQFIVMSLLGPDLNQMQKMMPKNRFSPGTVALICVQGIDALESLHIAGFVHRDIKPHNFMLGLREDKNIIYLIDFGLAKRIFDKDGKLMPPRDTAPFRGTMRYCATDSHRGLEYGRHHDLWGWFYSIVEMRKGDLPWSMTSVRRTFEVKRKIIPSKWLANLEPEYLKFYENLTTLKYSMTPDYERLKMLFLRVLCRMNLHHGSPMDWEPGGELFKKLKLPKLIRLFRDDEASTGSGIV